LVGENNANLGMLVKGPSDQEIGRDVKGSNVCVVYWMPDSEGPFKVQFGNGGQSPARYVLLANKME
jgi:hypothetical protein